jgi:single-strand DNA-binding protein|tara:strand:- start:15981 stop:16346 length:366 start_codon:yes stop_codon:yes gene_type:complete
MYNTIVTACHLVTDPELRDVRDNSKVCKIRVCISEGDSKNKCFIDAELWNRQAEIANEYLSKGRQILLQGELCQSSWEKDGKKYSKYFIRGKEFKFISSGGKKEEGSESKGESFSTEDVPF